MEALLYHGFYAVLLLFTLCVFGFFVWVIGLMAFWIVSEDKKYIEKTRSFFNAIFKFLSRFIPKTGIEREIHLEKKELKRAEKLKQQLDELNQIKAERQSIFNEIEESEAENPLNNFKSTGEVNDRNHLLQDFIERRRR